MKEALEAASITIPYPQQDVNIKTGGMMAHAWV